jgi:MFS family permease
MLLDTSLLIQGVALSYDIYRTTRDPLSLGLMGLVQAVPFIALALFGGHLADRYERCGIIRTALAIVMASSLLLGELASISVRATLPSSLWLLSAYGVVALLGFAGGLLEPAAAALRTQLVPRDIYGNSATWWSTVHQMSTIGGPVAGGFLYAWVGLSGSVYIALALQITCFAMVSVIKPRAVTSVCRVESEGMWSSLSEGFHYVWRTPVVLYAMLLDMLAVLFGGVTAILPVFAADVLKVGSEELGVLRAAPAISALLTVLVCTHVTPLSKPWRHLLLAVSGFGLAILVFALSQQLWLSLLALAASGAFDSISMIIRGALLQAVPPVHMSGRVMAVNSVFIGMSSQLGAFESGLAARWLGAVPSVIAGVAATGVVIVWVWSRSRALFAIRLEDCGDKADQNTAISPPCQPPKQSPEPSPRISGAKS